MLQLKWLNRAKKLSEQHRSYRILYHAMNSDSTICMYTHSLNRFMNHLVSIKELDHNERYDELTVYDSERIT